MASPTAYLKQVIYLIFKGRRGLSKCTCEMQFKKTQSFWRSLCDFNSCTIHIFWYLLRRCHMDSHDVTSQYSNFECRGQHVFHPATSKSPTILPTSNSITLLWKIWNRGSLARKLPRYGLLKISKNIKKSGELGRQEQQYRKHTSQKGRATGRKSHRNSSVTLCEYFVKLECHFSWRARYLAGAYFRGSVMTAHHLPTHRNTQPHRITTASHPIPSHHISSHSPPDARWHDIPSSHLVSNHITSSHPATNHMTSQRIPTNHTRETQPATRVVRAKNLVWAAHWLVALRTF